MLERVLVIGDVVVVVVWIGKERVACGKDVGCREVGRWQLCVSGVLDDEEVLGVVAQVLAEFVAQVGVCVAVADDFYRFGAAYGAVVGCDDDFIIGLCYASEELCYLRMAEP